MGDVDLRRVLRRALDARAELVLLAGRVQRLERAADGAADDVLRQLGAVLGPDRLDDAGLGIVAFDRQPDAAPELLDRVVGRLGRHVDGEPAIGAVALDARLRRGHRHLLLDRRCSPVRRACVAWVVALARRRDRVAVIARQLREIRRHVERLLADGRLVLDLVALQSDGAAARQGQARQARQDRHACRPVHLLSPASSPGMHAHSKPLSCMRGEHHRLVRRGQRHHRQADAAARCGRASASAHLTGIGIGLDEELDVQRQQLVVDLRARLASSPASAAAHIRLISSRRDVGGDRDIAVAAAAASAPARCRRCPSRRRNAWARA